MCRSVGWDDYVPARIPTGMHPYRMQERGVRVFFTERCIPNGIRFQKYCFKRYGQFQNLSGRFLKRSGRFFQFVRSVFVCLLSPVFFCEIAQRRHSINRRCNLRAGSTIWVACQVPAGHIAVYTTFLKANSFSSLNSARQFPFVIEKQTFVIEKRTFIKNFDFYVTFCRRFA